MAAVVYPREDLLPIYYAELAVGLAQSVAGVGLFLKRRKTFPIHGRSVPLGTFLVMTIQLTWIYKAWFNSQESPRWCSWHVAAQNTITSFVANIVWLRCFRLWVLYAIAREQLAVHNRISAFGFGLISGKGDSEPNSSKRSTSSLRFTNKRHLATPKWLLGILFATSAIQATIMFTTFGILSPGADLFDAGCLAIRASNRILTVLAVVTVAALAAIAYFIRNVRDNFHIKRECLVFLLSVLVLKLLEFVASGFTLDVIEWIPLQAMIAITTWVPVYLSFKRDRKSVSASVSKTRKIALDVSLEQILNDAQFGDALDSFKEHLVKEFSVENLVFYKATKQFEACQDLSSDEILAAALHLYVEFLAPASPYEVNIPYKIFHSIESELSKCFENFDAAKAAHIRSSAGLAFAKMGSVATHRKSVMATQDREEHLVFVPTRETSLPSPTAHVVPSKPKSARRASMSFTVKSQHMRTASGGDGTLMLTRASLGHIPNQDIYKEARQCLLSLMERDSFIRWRSMYNR